MEIVPQTPQYRATYALAILTGVPTYSPAQVRDDASTHALGNGRALNKALALVEGRVALAVEQAVKQLVFHPAQSCFTSSPRGSERQSPLGSLNFANTLGQNWAIGHRTLYGLGQSWLVIDGLV